MFNWFLGIINELPFNAVLKAKVEKLEEEKGVLETEVECLKDDLRKYDDELKKTLAENEELQKQLKHFMYADLSKIDIEILTYIAKNPEAVYINELPEMFNKEKFIIDYAIDTLKTNNFILIQRPIPTRPEVCMITGAGRRYLFTNSIITDE